MSAVVDVAVDAGPVEEVVARGRGEHMLAAGTQLLQTDHTLTLQHVTSRQILTGVLQNNKQQNLQPHSYPFFHSSLSLTE